MKSTFKIVLITAAALVVVATMQPASATCPDPRIVGSLAAYTYIQGPGTNTAESVIGNFWGWGNGQPAIGVGDDNGNDKSWGNADPGINWIKGTGQIIYLAGAWSNDQVDGCVDNATTPTPKRTVLALADTDPAGLNGFFGVWCTEPDSGLNYDYASLGNQVMIPIPKPVITSSSAVGGIVTVNVSAPDASAGVHIANASCTGLVRGYKVCQIVGATEPTTRLASAWTCGPEVPIATGTTVAIPQGAGSAWLATQLVYESGFASGYVSGDRQVGLGNLADRPGNFKHVKKPAKTNVRPQQ